MQNFKRVLSVALVLIMALAVLSVSAFAAAPVAKIGENFYSSLQVAIDDAAAGDTITLVADVTENVTVTKNLTLDGADCQYTGKITLNKVNATIENVNFVDGQIYKNKRTGIAETVTVKNCTFTGDYDGGYAVNLGAVNNITAEDCDAKDVGFGFLYVPSTNNKLTVKNVTVDGASYGISVTYNNSALFENVTISNTSYGILDQTYGAKTFTFKNCVINATCPVYIWERSATTQTFKFKGSYDFGTDDLTFGSELVKVVRDVAQIGDETYETVKEAIAAAEDGDIIEVILDNTIDSDDIVPCTVNTGYYTYTEIFGKKITLDLNGKTIAADSISADGPFQGIFFVGDEAELTITDSSEEKTGTIDVTVNEDTRVYSFLTADGTNTKLYLEEGNFNINRVDSQAMIYAGGTEQIYVSGGNYYMGNAGTRDTGTESAPYQPWMFNVYGDGAGNIVVTGGSYNTDPTHYHGETFFPDCYLVVKDAADVYTVNLIHTPGAAATCQAAQICTVCYTELDPIKSCEFIDYTEDNNATCTSDGTKTAACIYSCGATDSIVLEGTKLPHTPGAAATCQAAQTCTGCSAELDAIKTCEFVDYVADNNATCMSDGTKTAACIYNCGATHSVADDGTRTSHADADDDNSCDYCDKDICTLCGKIHTSFLGDVICLLKEFISLVASFISSTF